MIVSANSWHAICFGVGVNQDFVMCNDVTGTLVVPKGEIGPGCWGSYAPTHSFCPHRELGVKRQSLFSPVPEFYLKRK